MAEKALDESELLDAEVVSAAKDSETILTEVETEDEGPLDLPQSAFTPINFSSASRRVIDLYRSYHEDKELDPRPSFQRGYVWDRNRASKLIESILLHVPIPLIYTAEEEDGREVVIDGQQRLTTCFAFIEGFFPMSKADMDKKDKGIAVKRRPFKLGKMKILQQSKARPTLNSRKKLRTRSIATTCR